MLDEPTSVLAREEVELLFALVRALRSRASFIFVSHRLDEVLELCERVYVMKDGEVVDVVNSKTADIESIQYKMVGRNINKQYYREHKQKPYSACAGVACGVGYAPRERKVEGIVSGMNVFENITLSQMQYFSRAGLLRVAEENQLARDWVERLSIKTPSIYKDCGALSGGNQQKVVLAKWRSGGSDIVLLDHHNLDKYNQLHWMLWAGIEYVLSNSGPVTFNIVEGGAFWYGGENQPVPDLQFHFLAGAAAASSWPRRTRRTSRWLTPIFWPSPKTSRLRPKGQGSARRFLATRRCKNISGGAIFRATT